MKSTHNKLNSMIGSMLIALLMTLFFSSTANATWGNLFGSHSLLNLHGSTNSIPQESNVHGSTSCLSYEQLATKYKALSNTYLHKYHTSYCYSYFRSHLNCLKKYTHYINLCKQQKVSSTHSCDIHNRLANKYKTCANNYKAYADKYLARYNSCHWSCYYNYYLAYMKKYNSNMDLYNQYLKRYEDCQVSDVTTKVCGSFYEDLNNNGIKDNNETGQAGIQVKVFYTRTRTHGSHNHGSNNYGGHIFNHISHLTHLGQWCIGNHHGSNNDSNNTQSTETYVLLTTNAQGNYCTDKVPAGEAKVEVIESTLPLGAELTVENPINITVEAHKTNNIENIQYNLSVVATTGTLSGKVFEDADENSIFTDGEVGARGIIITITDSEGNEQHVVSQDGTYNFTNVAEGSVDIVVSSLPAGSVLVEGSALSFNANVIANQNTVAQDTGYTIPVVATIGTLSGKVFEDADKNSIFTDGEVGARGIIITITDSEGNEQHVVSQDGTYNFTNVAEGSVDIVVSSLPAGSVLVEGSALSFNANVIANQNTVAQDTGYTIPVVATRGLVSFYIFLDINKNENMDTPDRGIPNAPVTIIDANNVRHYVTSDMFGFVSVSLPLGSTKIEVNDNSSVFKGLKRNSGTRTVTIENLEGNTLVEDSGFVFHRI